MKLNKVLVHNIMGTKYVVKFGTREEIGLSPENLGLCRIYEKEILVCTEMGDCKTEKEWRAQTSEILAHELFHAYVNESGIDLEVDDAEEVMAYFYMKNWRKMNNSILAILDEIGLLDNI